MARFILTPVLLLLTALGILSERGLADSALYVLDSRSTDEPRSSDNTQAWEIGSGTTSRANTAELGFQGLLEQTAIEAVRELARRQQKLREATHALSADAPNGELVAGQSGLRRDLDGLAERLDEHEPLQTHFERARQAAVAAASKLFEGRRQQAHVEQGEVLDHLAAIEDLLQKSAGMTQEVQAAAGSTSAENAQRELSEVRQRQQQAMQQAAQNPQAAALEETAIAEALKELAAAGGLPPDVADGLIEAAGAADAAAAKLADVDQPTSVAEVEQASAAIDQAVAEVDAVLTETTRHYANMTAKASASVEPKAHVSPEIARGDFSLTDWHLANFIASFPTDRKSQPARINVYEVMANSATSGLIGRFDLFHLVEARRKRVTVFASFPHDPDSGDPWGRPDAAAMPEPSGLTLWGFGSLFLVWVGWRRRRRAVKNASKLGAR